ncbi:MAG: hypothetical protein IJJ33_06110 [Victivallales bacterium]|nr:hypothetical protein [Victivallales bacterium]
MERVIGIFALCALTTLALEPLAEWTFDTGKNLDAETGMAEFARSQHPVFPGLKSAGSAPCQLLTSQKADTARLFAPSLRGMALRTGVDEMTKSVFAASGRMPTPLSTQEGSIALWLRPENWDGDQQGRFRIFLAADDGQSPRTNELLLYKNGSSNTLIFLIGDNDPKKWCVIHHNVWGWKRGEWHFICASWTPDTLTLYIDGNVKQQPRPRLSRHDYHLLRLGSRGWKNEGGVTLLDDVAVFPHALKREEMEAYHVQTRPVADDRAAPITQRLGLTRPELDGRLDSFEYGMLLNSTFDIHSGEISTANRWAAARDTQCLYFACDTLPPSRPAKVTRRGGNVWEDESVELHLEYGGSHWQFILNAAQAVYDSKDNQPAWNAPNLRQAQSMADGRWTVEVALPFADLGIPQDDGVPLYFTLCRSSGGTTGHTAASPLLRKFADRENFIKLILDRNAVPMALAFQTLPGSEGKIDLTATLPPHNNATLQLLATDSKGRKLHESAVGAVECEGCAKAALHAEGLAKEGTISYAVTTAGTCLGQAELKYLSPEKVKVGYLMVHAERQVMDTMLALTPPLPQGMQLIQVLKTRDGQEALRARHALSQEELGKYTLSLAWSLADLPPGTYDYYLLAREGEREKVLHHQLFQKPADKMPWDDFQGGLEREAPLPWHTPTHTETSLACLTQVYDFGGRLLPAQILAQGTPLLDSPVTLLLDGKVLDLPATLEILQVSALETRFRTRTEIDGLRLEVNGALEYDGWLRLALTYASASPIESLALLLPMAPDASELVTTFRPSDTEIPNGRLERSYRHSLMDHPVFWLGNADHGLFWGADSLRGTHLSRTEDTLTITPRNAKHGARATIKLVDCGLAADTKRTVEFGLQATPVKPVQRIPTPYMLRGGYNLTLTRFHRIFNYYNPEFMDRRQARQQVETARRDHRAIYAFYSCIYGCSPFCPEWPWHCETWASTPPGPGQFKQDWPTNNEAARDRGLWTFGCVNHPQFLNWQLYYLNDIIQDKEVGLRDMYFDMAYPRACDNEKHGCGWKDDFGHLRKTYPINANRAFTKRIRKLLKDKDRDSVLMYHPSGEPLPPIYGLVDFVVDGEIYVAEVGRAESYYDIFRPDLMQSCYTGVKAGVNAVYISQLNRSAMLFNPARSEYWRRKVKAPEALRAVRHFLGYCLLHDIRPQAGACIYNEGEILERQLYSLGYDKGEFTFHPYWRGGAPVTATGPALVSAYTFPASVLAVVVNDSKTEEARVSLSLATGATARRVYDLEDGQEASFPIKVPPKGFRLVVFEHPVH